MTEAAQALCAANGWSWLQGPLIAFAIAFGVTGLFMAITGTPLIRINKITKDK